MTLADSELKVVRTLRILNRVAREQFWIGGAGPAAWRGWWKPADIVEQRPLEVTSDGPVVLWEDLLGTHHSAAELTSLHFSDNRMVEDFASGQPGEVDARGMEPLTDREFWPVIDVMEGRLWERMVSRAARSLSAESEEFLLLWAETAAIKAIALLKAFQRTGEIANIGPYFSGVAGATIGKGQSAYDAVLADPSAWQPRWETDNASQVLWIADHALDRRRSGFTITTSFTGIHLRGLQEITRPTAPWDEMQAARPFMRCARALVDDGSHVRMRIVLADVPVEEMDPRQFLGREVESFGGTLCSPVEVNPVAFAQRYPVNSDVFTIERPFGGDRVQYLELYGGVAAAVEDDRG